MTDSRHPSRWIAMTGLVVLIATILLPALSPWRAILAAPLIILLISGIKPPRRWGGWVAVAMIPYLCVAVGEVMVDPDNRLTYAIIVGATIIVFFASMLFVRKTGASLRR